MMERFRIMAEQVHHPPTLPTHILTPSKLLTNYTHARYYLINFVTQHIVSTYLLTCRLQERRAKSKFKSLYKVLEMVFPLVIPDEPEPSKPTEIETGEGDVPGTSGGGGVGASTTKTALNGTMRSELDINDADASRPGSSGGNGFDTPKNKVGKADRASRPSFQGFLHPTTPKATSTTTPHKGKTPMINKKVKKGKSFHERDIRLQRLETLYSGYLEER